MKYLKKYGALALCLALLAIPLLLAAPEVSAANYIADLPQCFLLKESYSYTGDLTLTVSRYGSDQTVITLNGQYFKYLKVTSAGIYVGNTSSLTSMTLIYSFAAGWVDQSWRYCHYLFNDNSYLDTSDRSCITFLTDGVEQVFPVVVYYGAVRSDLFFPLSQSVTISVTVDGFTVTDSDGNAYEYVYSGNYTFCGISEANDSLVEYEPGNSYEVLLSSFEKKFYVVDTSMLDYDLSVYGLSGDTVIDNVSSADPIEMNVTSTGATFQLTDQTLSYTYTGTEIFAGFATSTSGSVTYTPGNTYTLDASATSLYAKETARPTYAASFYDVTGSLIGSTGASYSPLTLQVTSTGATITLADGDPLTYTYTGTEIFAGFATSSTGAAVYTPGNTYTLNGATTSLYAKESARPTYSMTLYDVGSDTLIGAATFYDPITINVTSTGAVFTSGTESFEYTYSGTEIFAGFGAFSDGDPVYVPGKTYTVTAASSSLYALETPRPVYTITLYDTSGTAVVGPLKSYSPISFRITGTTAKFVTEEDAILSWSYSGDKSFLGFALDSETDVPDYRPGVTYTPKGYDVILFVVDKVIDLGAAGDILDVFAALSSFFIGMVITSSGVFYTAETGLTFLGALLVITSGVVTVFVAVYLVLLWIKNKK